MEIKVNIEPNSENEDSFEEIDAVPEMVGGKAAPPKRKRGRPALSEEEKALRAAARASGKPPPPKKASAAPERKTVKVNIAKGAGAAMLQGAARLPVFAADVAGTVISKGKFSILEFVRPEQLEECDRTFSEWAVGGMEFECTPLQAWLYTCTMVAGGAVVIAGMQYALALKANAGKLRPEVAEHVRRNGAFQGAQPTPGGMDPVREQSPSGEAPTA
jgi:hypothetical protein